MLFIIGGWNAKVKSQEIPGVTDKFGLGGQDETRQRLTEFCQETTLVIANMLIHQQMLNAEIILIIFFADGDGEALYSQQK